VSTAFKEVLNMKEVFTTNLLLINGLYRRQNFFLLSSPVRDEEEKQRRTTGDEKRKKLSNIYISLLLIELRLPTSFNSQTSLKAIGRTNGSFPARASPDATGNSRTTAHSLFKRRRFFSHHNFIAFGDAL